MRRSWVYGLGCCALLLASLAAIIAVTVIFAKDKDVPMFGNAYSVSGVIRLPYANIQEPFSVWYDQTDEQARIDYYNGTVKMYYLMNEGNYGINLKLVPVTTETYSNVITCFISNGTKNDPIELQSIIPDISKFTYVGTDILNDNVCDVWKQTVNELSRTNIYTFWLRWQKSESSGSDKPIPVRYEMIGYNTLTLSHYDHYYFEYTNYTREKPTTDVFEIPKNLVCKDMGANLSDPHVHHFNPMMEFVDRDTAHVDKAWEKFKVQHSKQYNDDEHDERKNIFTQNLRYIHSINRQGLGYNLKVNHLADRSNEEVKEIKGRLYKSGYNGAKEFPYGREYIKKLSINLPKKLDWRSLGAVTQVKDQAVCGSCWSYGTTGVMEGAYFIKTGKLVNFSQQALIDCSWAFGNFGCAGGMDFQAYQWIIKHGGIPTEENYGPYLGSEGFCHITSDEMMAPITSYTNVTSGSEEALKVALFEYGPVSVSIDASPKSFTFYSDGIFYENKCKNDPESLDHNVLAVGYGNVDGQNYWIIKNSWSTYWGKDGYILMSTKNNNCGVTTAATFIELKN